MHRIPRRLLQFVLCSAGLLSIGAALAAPAPQRYIHDELRVDMRTGPTFQNRIIDFLPSGTPITVLEEQDDWLRIRARDKEGWIQAQYTTDQPVARDQLAAARRELARAREERDALKARLEDVQGEAGDLGSAYAEATSEAERLRVELARVRDTSARALETAAALDALQGEAATLRNQVETLTADNVRLASDNRAEGIKWGAAAVLLGSLLAWIISAIGGRRRRSDWA
ncbi:MAG: TIGR04211 family SH3 domain-containing protein [Pseudomonadales bacterium]|jgi:SH3 domain protein|nr:TIGR04211 family SH3 domain-containing protein [Pseudomonadales bacterium]